MKDTTIKAEKVEMTPYQKKMMIFFFKCIASELSKTLIFFLIFYALGLAGRFWEALFFMMLYRTSSGGLHCKSYLSCLALSFVIIFSGVFLGIHIPVSIYVLIPVTLVLAIIAYTLSPVQAPTRPPLEERLVQRAKKRTFISIMIFLIIGCIFPDKPLTGIGFWLLVLHDVQLYIAYQIRRYRKDV